MPRIAQIGAGGLGTRRVLPSIRRHEADLVGICDLEIEKAQRAARRFGIEGVFTDYREMIEATQPDGVVICIGPEAHQELAREVMQLGCHVYTEKPPSTAAEQARAVAEVSRETGKTCMTAFKKRFSPAYVKAKAIIDSDDFAPPALLSIDYASGPYENPPDNPRRQFLCDFAIHIIDLSRFLFGEVAEVNARKQELASYAVMLRYESGAVGTLALTCNRAWAVSTEKVELTGAAGHFISLEDSSVMTYYSDGQIAANHKATFFTAGADSLVETGFAGEMGEFIAAIAEDRQPRSNIESSYRSMVLYEAIRDSAVTEEPVLLEGGEKT
jgi:UDP-N-acetylglucosamine 3-dehydrogenase